RHWGPFEHAYIDYLAVAATLRGWSPARAVREFAALTLDAQDAEAIVNSSLYELHKPTPISGEGGGVVALPQLVAGCHAASRLFHTYNHPGVEVFRHWESAITSLLGA